MFYYTVPEASENHLGISTAEDNLIIYNFFYYYYFPRYKFKIIITQ